MNLDELLSIWVSDADPPKIAAPNAQHAPWLNPALLDLFRRVFEAGLPPAWLRPLLAVAHWQRATIAPACDLQAALTRTEGLASTGHKRRRHLRRQLPTHCQHWLPDAAGSPRAQPRGQALTELDPDVDAIVFHPPGQAPLAFRRHQFEALANALRGAVEEAARFAQTEHTLALLGGAGALDECLRLTVYPADALMSPIDVGELRVVALLSEPRGSAAAGQSLRTICAQLAERTDYDGIAIDPQSPYPASTMPVGICWGPLSAAQMLAGIDARQMQLACPGRNLKAIARTDSFGLPGRFGRVRASDRERAAASREMAIELLAALGDSDCLEREHLTSAGGAAALRCYPYCGQRRWLLGFIERCLRVERTRWRVGLV